MNGVLELCDSGCQRRATVYIKISHLVFCDLCGPEENRIPIHVSVKEVSELVGSLDTVHHVKVSSKK